jgi:hypothetical protein
VPDAVRLCRNCDFARPLPGRSDANPLGDYLCDECFDLRQVVDADREYRAEQLTRVKRIKERRAA